MAKDYQQKAIILGDAYKREKGREKLRTVWFALKLSPEDKRDITIKGYKDALEKEIEETKKKYEFINFLEELNKEELVLEKEEVTL